MFILSSVIFSIIVNNYVKLTCTNERFNPCSILLQWHRSSLLRNMNLLLHPHTPDHTPYSTAAYTGYAASLPRIGPCDLREL